MQFLKFLAVGVLNTAFGYGVFAGLVLAGLDPMLALIATYFVGVPFNYLTTGRFVFPRSREAAFPRFVVAYVVIYGFNVFLYHLVAAAGATALVAQAVCVPIVAVFSFFLFKLQVFREHSSAASDQ